MNISDPDFKVSQLIRQTEIKVYSKSYSINQLIVYMYKLDLDKKHSFPRKLSIIVGNDYLHSNHIVSFIQAICKFIELCSSQIYMEVNMYISKSNNKGVCFEFNSYDVLPDSEIGDIKQPSWVSYSSEYEKLGDSIVSKRHVGCKFYLNDLLAIPHNKSLHDLLLLTGYTFYYRNVLSESKITKLIEEQAERKKKSFPDTGNLYTRKDSFDDAFGDDPESAAGWLF